MAALRKARKLNQALFPQFESLKQGRLAQVYYLVKDYKAVFLSAFTYTRDKPLKVILQLTTLGLGSYAWNRNPNFTSYTDSLMESSNQLMQVSGLIRNRNSDSYVRDLTECFHQNRLRCRNFGIFTLIFKDNYGEECDLYDKNCYYMKPRWLSMKDQFVDIGFLGRWYQLEKAMIDFDINEEEFASEDCEQ